MFADAFLVEAEIGLPSQCFRDMDLPIVQDDFIAGEVSALPLHSTTEAVESLPEQIFNASQSRGALRPRSELAGRELYSKDQWEIQKPIIRQLYNLENKPFKRVIEILRTEHDFFPTRRQFYRKISEWGFEKNVKDKEMRAAVKYLDDRKIQRHNSNMELKSPQIDPVKIQRWKKRHGKTNGAANPFQSKSHNVPSMQESFSDAEEDEMPQENDNCPRLTLNNCAAEVPQPMDDAQNSALDRWGSVDIPGSPLLTRLFEALNIECEGSIPCLDLRSSSIAVALPFPEEANSDADVMEDINSEVVVDFSLGAASKDLVYYSQEVFCGPRALLAESDSTPAALSFSEWSFREWDFAEGQPIKTSMDYLYGISPYPVSAGSDRHLSLARRKQSPLARSLELRDRENKARLILRRSKMILGEDNESTILAAYDLGFIYRQQWKYREAERLFRQVAVYYNKIYGLKHTTTLNAYMEVLDTLMYQGRQMQAIRIHENIHEIITKLVRQDNKLALWSTGVRSYILRQLCQYEEAEKLSRQTLQIILHTRGLRESVTIERMSFLGDILSQRGKFAEGERLMRTSLQLCNETGAHSSQTLRNGAQWLSQNLRKQGRYGECRDLVKTLVKRFGGPAAGDNPEIFNCLLEVAMCARAQGQLSESEHQLRTILERQIKCLGTYHPFTRATKGELSFVLWDMGHRTEAISLMERNYEESCKLYGLAYLWSLWYCRVLAGKYVALDRWDDAIALLQRSFEHAMNSGESRSQYLLVVGIYLAICLRKIGQHMKAVTYYEECLKGFPDVEMSLSESKLILFDLLLCYDKLGRYDDLRDISQRYPLVCEAEKQANSPQRAQE